MQLAVFDSADSSLIESFLLPGWLQSKSDPPNDQRYRALLSCGAETPEMCHRAG